MYNKDWPFAPKSMIPNPPGSQWVNYYCLYNGWLSPEIKALQHDYEGLQLKASQFCEHHKAAWQGITMAEHLDMYGKGLARGKPTPEEAHYLGLSMCALGTPACDMAMCGYSFCLQNTTEGVSIGMYDNCKGWDPVGGMPIPSEREA